MPHATKDEAPNITNADTDGDTELPDAPPESMNEESLGNGELHKLRQDRSDIKLEDIFNDDDNDDEFPDSSPLEQQAGRSPPAGPL